MFGQFFRPTIGLFTSPNPSAAGQPFAVTTLVRPPAPYVNIYIDGIYTTTISTGPDNFGHGSLPPRPVGIYQIYGEFPGDELYHPSGASASHRVVASLPTVTTLTANANPAAATQPVLLTASVTGMPQGGSASFFNGDTLLGVVTLDSNSQASLPVIFRVGTYALTARFSGLGNVEPSISAVMMLNVFLPAVTAIPTLHTYTVAVLTVLLAAVAVIALKKA